MSIFKPILLIISDIILRNGPVSPEVRKPAKWKVGTRQITNPGTKMSFDNWWTLRTYAEEFICILVVWQGFLEGSCEYLFSKNAKSNDWAGIEFFLPLGLFLFFSLL